jgi:hypothetical protein
LKNKEESDKKSSSMAGVVEENDESKKGLGGTCKDSRLPSNKFTTLFIGGWIQGPVCMHYKPTIIIFLTVL